MGFNSAFKGLNLCQVGISKGVCQQMLVGVGLRCVIDEIRDTVLAHVNGALDSSAG
jgi:hypothetical protein